MKNPESISTLVVLANVNEVVAAVARNVLGNEVASTFDGQDISRAIVQNMAQTNIQADMAKYMGA